MSKPIRIASWLAALVSVGSLAVNDAGTAPRGLQVDDLVRLERVSDVRLRPGTAQVAYVLRRTDMAANKGVNGIWLQALEGGEPRLLSAEGSGANSPRWSADGRFLYFLSTRSGSQQVWRIDMQGGEALQVTQYPIDVGSFRLAPDSQALALSLEVFADCADLACTAKRLEARATNPATGAVHDKMFVRHWDTWADGRRNHLYVASLDASGRASDEPDRLSRGIDGDVPSKPSGDDSEFAFAPDGRSVVFSVRIAGTTEPMSTNFDLYRAEVAGAAPLNLTASNPAMDTGPLFSSDGKTLFYRAMKRPGFEADRLAVMALDLASGTTREVAPGWDSSADSLALSADGNRLYTHAYELGSHALFAIDTKTGKVQRLVGDGTVSSYDVDREHLVFTRDAIDSPGQLFVARTDGKQAKQISRFNAELLAQIRMGAYEQFSFKGADEATVYGFVTRPWHFEAGEKYPVAMIIHGGPQGSMGNNFHYRWNPQTYAGQGWATVFIDFHGSTGYGQAFTDAISGDWGGKPLEDLQKGWAAALARYDFLDADRACALGASYGGFMVNWIAGKWPQPWKCLVSHSGVFDQRMMGFATEEQWFTDWENGGSAIEKPENYERFNPIRHVAQWQVPMLVVHGQLDFRIPVEQGLAVFTALQRRGIDSQFLYFPDENHWILKPANSVLWHQTVNAWLHKHLD